MSIETFIAEYVKSIDVDTIINKRVTRADMKVGHHYMKHQNGSAHYAGTFHTCSYSGSGDGMEIHFWFNLNNKIYKLDDQMWGSVSGKELMYFTEIPVN
jgi:hypothetical protein